ncbi:hypothetical protein COCSADRAFT_263457 [Bipolaris sorokiniana ND90Pr]|nr:uncharacterized protein COCSADRAFT_263457 [Bipolaris sorokiniana ND90Pr]EMD59111.1 hypothetical protein COCSADRAFT_263457 [Bipolaris sorokiniana ND90Pr]
MSVAALAGMGAPGGGASDVGVTAAHEGRQERGEHVICEGERVYAVCCRKVKLELIDGFVDDACLASKDVWVSYYPARAVKEGVSLTQVVIDDKEDVENSSEVKEVLKSCEGDIFETLHSDGGEKED